MAKALTLAAHSDLAGQVLAVEEDGFAYLPRVLDAEQVTELREHMEALQPLVASFDKDRTIERDGRVERAVNNAFNRDRYFAQFLDYPGIIELAEALHGEDCHVIGMTSWLTGPGRPDQQLHADWHPLAMPPELMADPRVRIPVFISTTHFYLDDMSEELGPTRIVPGSHRAGHPPSDTVSWEGNEEESILCTSGDAVVFRSEVWHRGTSNHSHQVRYLLQVHYAQRMIAQKFPPYLNRFQFDPQLLLQATPRQLRLLGDHVSSNYD